MLYKVWPGAHRTRQQEQGSIGGRKAWLLRWIIKLWNEDTCSMWNRQAFVWYLGRRRPEIHQQTSWKWMPLKQCLLVESHYWCLEALVFSLFPHFPSACGVLVHLLSPNTVDIKSKDSQTKDFCVFLTGLVIIIVTKHLLWTHRWINRIVHEEFILQNKKKG